MKFGVVVFPGTWSDVDCYEVIDQVLKYPVQYVWHNETDLSDYDCIILPGGFSYGDFLRPGAIAKFSPVMRSLQNFSEQGKTIIGICNGFQILCEAGLLPGVLLPNDHLQFRCQWVNLKIENAESKRRTKLPNHKPRPCIVCIPIPYPIDSRMSGIPPAASKNADHAEG